MTMLQMRPGLLPALIAVCALLLCACRPTQPDTAPNTASAKDRPEVRLRYIEGSTVKVEQLIGDVDNQTKQPTFNQTSSRYSIRGTDLGYSFEHKGKTHFLFGDTVGSHEGDPIGVSASTNPLGPLALDFLTNPDGSYLRIEPAGISMAGFEIPTSGISIDGVAYVAVKTNYTPRSLTDHTLLTRYDESHRSFEPLRELSRLPNGRFITTSIRLAPSNLKGLPSSAATVLIFGSGQYRRSNAYLAAVPAKTFANGAGTRYFAGLDAAGKPLWSEVESDAAPIIDHATIGDLSVQYVPSLALWVALYDSRSPRGVLLRYATEPWGPWTAPQVIFEPIRDQAWGVYIHNPNASPPDELGGPVIGPNTDVMRTQGGYYAPYMIERFTRVEGDKLTLQYVLSTWNPYVVVRMRSSLAVDRGKQASAPSGTDQIATLRD
jgi:hypothetical protein